MGFVIDAIEARSCDFNGIPGIAVVYTQTISVCLARAHVVFCLMANKVSGGGDFHTSVHTEPRLAISGSGVTEFVSTHSLSRIVNRHFDTTAGRTYDAM